MDRVCALGGANAPFEQIYSYVGGRVPGGRVDFRGLPELDENGRPDAREILWVIISIYIYLYTYISIIIHNRS